MLPGGSAADIEVNHSDSIVSDIHPRRYQIARFTFLEQSRPSLLVYMQIVLLHPMDGL